MELWQALLVAFGGNAALLFVIAYLGRSLISNFLTKDLEKFKGDLQVAAIEHQIRFSKLHEKRAEVLSDLYSLLVVAIRETESFAQPLELVGEPDKNQKYRKAMNAIVEYFSFFDQNRIYMPEELCSSLEALTKKLRSPTIEFGVYLQIEQPNEGTTKEKLAAWIAAWDSVKNDIPQLRTAIEGEFRKLLGATTLRAS